VPTLRKRSWREDSSEKYTLKREKPKLLQKKPFYLQVRAGPLHNTYNVGNDAKDRMQNLKLKIMVDALISILSTSKILFLLIRGIPTGRDELSTPASKYTRECSGEK